MKGAQFYIIAIAGSITIVAVIYGVALFSKSDVAVYNRSLRDAKKAYAQADYKTTLSKLRYVEDSLRHSSDELKLNLAHSAFLVAKFNASNNIMNDILKKGNLDSLKKQEQEIEAVAYLMYYDTLIKKSANNSIASIASNQMGVAAVNLQDTNLVDDQEKHLNEVIDYFKVAIKKDPSNLDARYNYELIKKKKDFPKRTMEKVKLLVRQHKYQLAYDVLAEAIQKDPRVDKLNSGYLVRLESIMNIDKK
jgi:tetratricopeptide (TPR) repeat protein